MPKQVDGLFDDLQDESPTTLGQEVGNALTAALKSVEQSQEEYSERTTKILEALTKQLAKLPPKQETVVQTPEPITEWVFDVIQDKDGRLKRIVAKARR